MIDLQLLTLIIVIIMQHDNNVTMLSQDGFSPDHQTCLNAYGFEGAAIRIIPYCTGGEEAGKKGGYDFDIRTPK